MKLRKAVFIIHSHEAWTGCKSTVHSVTQLPICEEKIIYYSIDLRSRGSSVSTVSGHGLDRQRRKDFSSTLCVQTGSEAHPSSCTMGTGGGGPYLGAKARPGRDADHLPPSSAEVENE
jgi:hypothetical protein